MLLLLLLVLRLVVNEESERMTERIEQDELIENESQTEKKWRNNGFFENRSEKKSTGRVKIPQLQPPFETESIIEVIHQNGIP